MRCLSEADSLKQQTKSHFFQRWRTVPFLELENFIKISSNNCSISFFLLILHVQIFPQHRVYSVQKAEIFFEKVTVSITLIMLRSYSRHPAVFPALLISEKMWCLDQRAAVRYGRKGPHMETSVKRALHGWLHGVGDVRPSLNCLPIVMFKYTIIVCMCPFVVVRSPAALKC